MKPIFRTNIDICKDDVQNIGSMWPEGVTPRIGERIQLLYYQLEVFEVRYEPIQVFHEFRVLASLGSSIGGTNQYRYSAVVELHIPRWFSGTLTDWEVLVKKQQTAYINAGLEWPPRVRT